MDRDPMNTGRIPRVRSCHGISREWPEPEFPIPNPKPSRRAYWLAIAHDWLVLARNCARAAWDRWRDPAPLWRRWR